MERGIGNSHAALIRVMASLSFLAFVLAIGCVGTEMALKEAGETARIHSIHAVEEDGKVKVIIEGNRHLECTPIRQPYPLSVVLHLQGASLDDAKVGEVEENEIISSVGVSESISNAVASRIEISLKKDVAFEVEAIGNTLVASFSKNSHTENVASSAISSASDATAAIDKPEFGAGTESVISTEDKQATHISDVEAVAKDEFVEIIVRADGSVTDFESFTVEESVENPARIVFDLFNVNAGFEKERKIELGSNFVERVRFKGYKDRIRLVVDTRNQYLANFLATPSIDGLRIAVADKSETENKVGEKNGEEATVLIDSGKTDAQVTQVSEDATRETALKESDLSRQDVVAMSGETVAVAELSEPSADKAAGAASSGKSEVDSSSVSATVKRKNTLSSVSATPIGDSLLVSVGTSAPVDKYNVFTLKNFGDRPARIVVDMFGLHSPFKKEKMVPVDFENVSRVRHMGYSEKVRLVIDTQDSMLSTFTARPAENGLEIKIDSPSENRSGPVLAEAEVVGGKSSSSEILVASAGTDEFAPKSADEAADRQAVSAQPVRKENVELAAYSGPNWIKRIDFSSRPAGESTLLIGAARPIRYEIKEISDKKLVVKLFETRIAEHQKRPLITTRFESAVDRILPIQTSSMKDLIISVEMREKTPYQVEAFGNDLLVNFEASSIPPKPLEEASLPSWQQAMAEPLAETAIVSSATPPLGPVSTAGAGFDPKSAIQEMPVKGYTGEKIALDFFETDIKNVFRILREVSGKNFAIDKDVDGSVTLTLEKPVPWDQVLDLVLKMNQLGKVEEGDIIRIAKTTTITKEEQDLQAKLEAEAKAREQERALEPLLTEYIPINYSDARSEILPHLENIATPDRGKLSVDGRTNMVIMTDTAEKVRQAREIVQRLDKVTPQVIIEARIVEASSTFSREIGIEWTMDSGIPNNDPRAGIGPQRGYDALGGTWAYDTAVNLPVPDTGTIGFQFKRIFGTPLTIDAQLGAMESQGEGKVVSAPKVMTLDNKKATIKQGREVPYAVVDDNGKANVEFKKVDLLLEVTPHVTPDSRISLRVFITKNEIAEFSLVDRVPSLATKEAETELLVNDGETIVIGGILQTTDQDKVAGVPGLYKIPVLSWLFKWDKKESRKEELLIFLTPRIMQLEQRDV